MADEHPVRVAQFGLGGVGRAFLELVDERHAPVHLVAVADSSGVVVGHLDPREALENRASGGLAARGEPLEPAEAIRRSRPDVVLDLTGSDFWTGEPSSSILAVALSEGLAAVTANKAALARRWPELSALAGDGPRIGCTAAAGAALPAVAVARSLSRTGEVSAIEGVLTGTTTFVLDELAGGRSLEEAVAAAQAAGIAEPDPSVDLGGWDTAAKLVILANSAWPEAGLVLDDVDVHGIEATAAASAGRRPMRVLGRVERVGPGVSAWVSCTELQPAHPLAGLAGREKGVVFTGPEIGRVVVTGGRSHPRAAAAAALADVLELGCRDVPAERRGGSTG